MGTGEETGALDTLLPSILDKASEGELWLDQEYILKRR